jgi:hypothetical protein
MIFDQYLDPEPNTNVTIDKDNKAVQTALKLIRSNFTIKQKRDEKNKILRDMIEAGFEVHEPNGTRKINLKKLQQVYWKVASRMKPLDYALHASQRPEFVEKITTDGVSTVLRKGGYIQMYRDKGGMFQNSIGYGDAFGLFGTIGTKGFPLQFLPIPNDNVYVDTRATTMRNGSKPVKKCAVIMVYTWSEFVEMFPKMAKKAGVGRIPRDNYDLKDQDQSYEQVLQNGDDDIIEVCYYYDIANMHHVVFAGSGCTVIEEVGGDNYPFKFKSKETRQEEAYIPVLHMMCMESFEGFYNHGVFEMIYDLCVLYYRLMNKNANQIEDNADPYVFFSVPEGRVGEMFQKMDMAARMRAAGKRPLIPLEYDSNNPNGSQVQASTPLTTQAMLGEASAMFDLIDREIKRLGIHLDELESANVTATQVLSEEENANSFVKQMMEKNASETEFVVKVVLDLLPKVIKKSDKTPLQMTTTIDVEGVTVRTDTITLGDLVDEISNNDYFVKVNVRSGTNDSKLKKAQVANMLQFAAPGTPAHAKLLTQFAQQNDSDLRGEDFGMPQAGGGQMPDEIPQDEPTGTDRLAINPRQADQMVAF